LQGFHLAHLHFLKKTAHQQLPCASGGQYAKPHCQCCTRGTQPRHQHQHQQDIDGDAENSIPKLRPGLPMASNVMPKVRPQGFTRPASAKICSSGAASRYFSPASKVMACGATTISNMEAGTCTKANCRVHFRVAARMEYLAAHWLWPTRETAPRKGCSAAGRASR
jgi:hypothetical protein